MVGDFSADVIVEGKVLLELKAVDAFSNRHFAQLLNYLRATGIDVGMVINFGTPKIQYRRFNNRFGQDKTMDDSLRDLIQE